MDQYEIVYAEEALQDLRDIADYIAIELKEQRIANTQISRIRKEIRLLSYFPNRYKTVDWEPWASRHMHQLLVDHYVVFYLVCEAAKTVHILRILYGRRDLSNIINS